MRAVIVVALLIGCAAPAIYVDGGRDAVGDAWTWPTPACVPASTDPTCSGDCSGMLPQCPPGYLPTCGGVGWMWSYSLITEAWGCSVDVIAVPQCGTSGPPGCTTGSPSCLAPHTFHEDGGPAQCDNPSGF